MLRRCVAGLVSSLLLLAAVGCGESGAGESPKVANPSVKVKPMSGDPAKPNAGGPRMKPDN